ncbi:MAG: right-handed parallel beta-helix repeat-containing protein [Candidatus Aenigmarchaeota archaeon]|nr:right-handed parallel beta-helix repeat-containing protein [Candidatus Aenigmarchaeota archaeon]
MREGCIVVLSAFFLILNLINFAYATNGCGTGVECGSLPTDNCDVTQNTVFSTGFYDLNSGIDICASNISLNCNSSVLNGTGELSAFIGIHVKNQSNITIWNCNIQNYQIALRLEGSSNDRILNNSISQNTQGIVLAEGALGFSNNIIIQNNRLLNNRCFPLAPICSNIGIRLSNSDNNTIINNSIKSQYAEGPTSGGRSDGIDVRRSLNNTIMDNVIQNISRINSLTTSSSVRLGPQSHANLILNNTILDIGNFGIEVIGPSSFNVFFNNTIVNTSYGVYLNSTENNTAYHNNFINNSFNLKDNGSNFFNISDEGNYYSNYDEETEGCFDENVNGICDANLGNDHFPFCNLNGWTLDFDVRSLSVINATGTERVFEFTINNYANLSLANVSWSLETGQDMKNSTLPVTLTPYERLFVYVYHNYTASGTYIVTASAQGNGFRDVESIVIIV